MIVKCSYNDLAPILPEAEKAIKLKVLRDLKYWAFYDNDKIVGFVSLKLNPKKAKLHSAYVMPEYRRKGIYQKLNEVRWNYIINAGIPTVEANCTNDSIGYHLKHGAVIVQEYAICKKVIYSLL